MATPRPCCMHAANMSQTADQETISWSMDMDELQMENVKLAQGTCEYRYSGVTGLDSRLRFGLRTWG